ncbi:MAG TPA: formate/nitrite transporter family protein, partial [Chloroflexota bacterium]
RAAERARGESPPRSLVLSALAGAYVGLGVALIFAVGAPLAAAASPFTKLVMGASFGVALSLVLFAGAELFTRNALVLTVGALTGRSTWSELAAVWGWSYVGNVLGSLALAWLLAQSRLFAEDPQRSFLEGVAAAKMHLPFGVAVVRGILANWLVCLAVWCSMRTSSDAARLGLVFWCLFAFIGAGFEHSVANMTLLAIVLLQEHGEAISWTGYLSNLVPVTIGNVIGGALFVGGLYWLSAPSKRLASSPAPPSTTVAVGLHRGPRTRAS